MSDSRSRRSPLRGKYLVGDSLGYFYLRASDAALGILVRHDRPEQHRANPRRLLIAVGGHLGDAVIATGAIALVKRTHPEIEIGVVSGSWSRPVFENHPDIARLHTVDHWKLIRAPWSMARKIRRHRHTRAEASREIRDTGYDVAIDLYPFYPNAAELLWRSGIPIRVGWASGGFGPLYTTAVDWTETAEHALETHARLIRTLLPGPPTGQSLRYALPPVPATARESAERLLVQLGVLLGRYLVVHAGAGNQPKQWGGTKWLTVVTALVGAGVAVVLTGIGPDQARAARGLASATGCIDLTDRLNWHEFVHVIARARGLVSVDTVAGHVASAVGTPNVWLASGMIDPAPWSPVGELCTLITHPVPCSPCFRSHGCATMACIRDVAESTVLEAIEERFALPLRGLS